MKQVNVHEAKTHLSQLLDQAEAGEEIIIARGGKPAARLVPVGKDKAGVIGLLRDKLTVSENFDDPLPDELLDGFEGETD